MPHVLGRSLAGTALALAALVSVGSTWAAEALPKPTFTIHRTDKPITVDGELSDPGWQGVEPITKWYETNAADNVEPQVKNVAWLAYDDHFLYAAFQFDDPKPQAVRAPLGDHDAVSGSTDYGGVIIDTHNDGKTAQMFLANPRGVQYDAISSDATGEDSSPDFYWDAVGKITATGWSLEMRIPFSSLRYENGDAPTMGILLYRNYPRERHYQFFTSRLPKDVNCFICNSAKLVGLENLPQGSHLVVAPFATSSQTSTPQPALGSPLHAEDVNADAGLDLKWTPSSGLAIDATLNPDFSQVESDAAQIVANERFALAFPEKRPFFLEGIDLFAMPMLAVYTRTITSPRGGLRATGKIGGTAYSALLTQDDGGGIFIVPGPQGSSGENQDFRSDVGIFRVRHDLGRSFVSLFATSRLIEHGGSNVVMGPDFQWRPRDADAITGQALFSHSQTSRRPDLAAEWDGRALTDHATQLGWSHQTRHVDWYLQGQDIGPDFRDDNGFITQVGYREGYAGGGYTIRPPKAFLSRVRFFTEGYYDQGFDQRALTQHLQLGAGMDGRLNTFLRLELNRDNFRVGEAWLQRFRPRIQFTAVPGRIVNQISIDTYFGDEVDFDNARRGSGVTALTGLTLRPTAHVELLANYNVRTLHVRDDAGRSKRLFTATTQRLRTTYAFSARSFVRLIGQYVQTRSDPTLYGFPVDRKDARFTSSALFAYKLNWQTVLYVGYGDDREYNVATDALQKNGGQAFAKVSYAWQP